MGCGTKRCSTENGGVVPCPKEVATGGWAARSEVMGVVGSRILIGLAIDPFWKILWERCVG
jgi:hypothetical protein